MKHVLEQIKNTSRIVSNNRMEQLHLEETLLIRLAMNCRNMQLKAMALKRKKEIDREQIEILGG